MLCWKPGWSAMCPSCGHVVERTSHMARWREPGRKKILRSSVGELADWVYETTDDCDTATSLSKHLMSQGESLLKRLDMNLRVHQKTPVTGHIWSKKPTALAGTVCCKGKCQNNGSYLPDWDSRGRVIRRVRKDGLDASSISLFESRTNNGYTVIIKCIFGLRVVWRLKSTLRFVDRLGELMYTDPDELLPQHQHVLMVNPSELREGPLSNKQVWISKIEATRLAKEKVNETGTRGGVNKRN